MKRKWVWALAIVPVVTAFIFAWRLADKRPRLVARGFKTAEVMIAPDGKKIVAFGGWSAHGQIVRLGDGSRTPLSSGEPSFFSPDGSQLYQLNFEMENGGKGVHCTLVLCDADSGRKRARHQFESGVVLYGASWQGGEIVAESARQTWHLDARTLRIISTRKRAFKLSPRNATLCPDGETFWFRDGENRIGMPMIVKFVDLRTGQELWQAEPVMKRGTPLGFSGDGRTVLLSDNREPMEIIARHTRTGAEKWRMRGPQSFVLALAPDQSAIYEARTNGEIWKWPR